MAEKLGFEVIEQTRFLVVDGDKNALAAIEQFLTSAGAQRVTIAQSPIIAPGTLQDAAARVDCVICAHKKGTITGVQFLQALRAGAGAAGASSRSSSSCTCPTSTSRRCRRPSIRASTGITSANCSASCSWKTSSRR